MAGKRKDKKGRILLKNESERSDGRYQYRYIDVFGKRQTIYAPTLDELRPKEKDLRTARKEPFEVIGEKSIWQTMGRTINTTLTTLFTIGMVYILGVPSLKQFTLPLIVGILAGGWSSVMLSTGLWGFFRKKFRRRRKI